MKKFIILFLFSLLNFNAFCQEADKKNGISLQIGISGRSYYSGLSYSYTVLPKLELRLSGLYESFGKKRYNHIEIGKLKTFYVDLTGAYKVADISPKVALNALLGVSGISEKLQYEKIQRKSETAISVGGLIGAELVFMVSEKFHVLLNGTQRFCPGSEIGTKRWMAGLGLKYKF